MDNTLTWLHLSDLHCCPRTDWDARHVLAALRDDLAQLADEHELRRPLSDLPKARILLRLTGRLV